MVFRDEIDGIGDRGNYTIIPNELWNLEIGGSHKTLWGYLASCSPEYHPTRRLMAFESGIGHATIERILPDLLAWNMLAEGPVNAWGTQTYILKHPNHWTAPRPDPKKRPKSRAEKVRKIMKSVHTQNEGNNSTQSHTQNEGASDSIPHSKRVQSTLKMSTEHTQNEALPILGNHQHSEPIPNKQSSPNGEPHLTANAPDLRTEFWALENHEDWIHAVPAFLKGSIQAHGLWAPPDELRSMLRSLAQKLMPAGDQKWDTVFRGKPRRDQNLTKWIRALDRALVAHSERVAAVEKKQADDKSTQDEVAARQAKKDEMARQTSEATRALAEKLRKKSESV